MVPRLDKSDLESRHTDEDDEDVVHYEHDEDHGAEPSITVLLWSVFKDFARYFVFFLALKRQAAQFRQALQMVIQQQCACSFFPLTPIHPGLVAALWAGPRKLQSFWDMSSTCCCSLSV